MLYLDFSHRGVRYREQTALQDTPVNRKSVESLAKRIEKEIRHGTFDYVAFFPDSPRARKLDQTQMAGRTELELEHPTPTFGEFADLWAIECAPGWRNHYREEIRNTLDRIILPAIGDKPLSMIDRGCLLGFQAELAKRSGRNGQTISTKRINKVMGLVKAILNEGCDRYDLQSTARSIKRLKQGRTDVMPFSLDEVNTLIDTVRKDFQPYLTVRLLTGLRTGEADGLQWQDVDFGAGVLHIRRSYSRTGDGGLKTQSSSRVIPMVPQVRAALEVQRGCALGGCPWVFHSPRGNPIDAPNFTNRIWYPLLRYLNLRKRPPYQMRHNAATLMLAAGENPEWVAKVLGHSTTEMLFRVYSRFVPNLTRNDGLAFAGLVNGSLVKGPTYGAASKRESNAEAQLDVLKDLSPEQLQTLVELVRKAS